MRNQIFVLDKKGNPVAELDFQTWADWMWKVDRRVADEQVGASMISTVFLGLDHNWTGDFPVLWETLVFDGPMDQECERCSGSREQAEAMHARMVERVKNATR